MGAANIRAGGAYVELFVKDGSVQKTLANVRKQLTTFGQSIRNVGLGGVGLGTAIGAPLLAAVSSFSDAGDAVDKMAGRTGMGTDAIQELAHAAGLSGTSIEALENGLRKMQKTIGDATNGSKMAVDAFGRIGVTLEDLKSLSPDQQMELIADKLAGIDDPALKAAAAMEIFGKSGTSLLPMMADGSAGIQQMRAEARALGLVLSGEDVTAAAKLNDALGTMWSTLKAVTLTIGASVAPAVTMFANFMVSAVSSVQKFINQNRGLVIGVGMVAVALVGAGSALVGIGTLIQVVGFAVGGLATAWAAFGVVLSTIAGSPLLLVLAGIIAVTVAIPRLREAAGEAFGFLFGGFTKLGEIVSETMGGVADALAGGDLKAAADVLWAGLYAAWLQGTEQIRAVWRQLVANIASFGLDVFATFRSGWAETVRFFSDAWDMAVGGMGGVWSDFQNEIAAGMAEAISKITGLDSKDMQQSVREEQEAIKGASAARMAARSRETADKLAAIERERIENQKSLSEDAEARNTAAQQGLENAKAALAAARENAKAVKDAAVKKREESVKPRVAAVAADVGSQFAATLGTFSASSATRSQVSGLSPLQTAMDRTAEATEQIAENTREGGKFG